jgi:hypothetical protein
MTLSELKEEGAEPLMRPNESATTYVPVDQAYFDWYWSEGPGAKEESEHFAKMDAEEEYMTSDRYADLTEPGLYDREPDEPGMDYGPEDDD